MQVNANRRIIQRRFIPFKSRSPAGGGQRANHSAPGSSGSYQASLPVPPGIRGFSLRLVSSMAESFRITGFVLLRFAARDAKRLPLRVAQMLREEDDLSDVLSVVSQGAVERLQ